MGEVWEIMSGQLHFIHHAFNVRILAFVLMNNHFHSLVATPDANLDRAMAWFMRETSRWLTKSGNRINQTYGGRYFKSVIGSPIYYLNCYKYVYYNPVKAGLCLNVADYPYSSLSRLLGFRHLAFPLENDETLFNDVEGTLAWLNRAPSDENWSAIKRASRRSEFRLPRLEGRKHPLENDTL